MSWTDNRFSKHRLINQLSRTHSAEERSNPVTRVAVAKLLSSDITEYSNSSLEAGMLLLPPKVSVRISRNASNVDECRAIAQFR